MSKILWKSLLASPAVLAAALTVSSSAIATTVETNQSTDLNAAETQAAIAQTNTPSVNSISETSAASLLTADSANQSQQASINTQPSAKVALTPITEAPASAPAATPSNAASLEQIGRYSLEGSSANSVAQVTSVSQLSDVQPTDWAFQALQSLVERYGCIAGYPDGTYRGNRALTRYEFAAGLNACLDRVNELIAAGTADLVSKEDLATLQRLQEEFAAELATLRGRVDALEARTAELEANQFSTTTKLVGEVIFAVTDEFGLDDVTDGNNTVFQDRVRLDFQTSFTGNDVLHTRLAAGNAIRFSTPGGTAEGTQQFNIGDTGGNDIILDWLAYYFPVGENLQLFVAATGGIHSDYVYSTVNRYLEDYDGGSGALSAFGQESPIYRIGGGAGGAFTYKFGDALALTAGYLAGPDASSPAEKNGLFNGNYAALGQLTFTASDALQVGLTYVHGYHRPNTGIFNLGAGNDTFFTGTNPANTSHTTLDTPAVTNSYGAEVSFQLSPNIVINGFFGYTDVIYIGTGSDEIWYYGLGLAFPDLGKEGNLAGIVVGVEPYLGGFRDVTGALVNDTSLHVEGFYKYQLTDNISITPGVIWITAPNQNNDNDDIIIGTLRTTFKF